MKKFLLIFLFLIVHLTLCIEHCICQPGWNLLTPYPAYSAIYSVKFVNTNTGWFIGKGIMKTTNGGLTFINQHDSGSFKGCYFIDENTGWATKDNGNIMKTTNSGTNWIIQFSYSQSLNSIYFVNSNTGWTIDGNEVLKTTNGGTNWILLATLTGYLNNVCFTDINNGFIGGNPPNSILKTTNGGLNWTASNLNAFIYSIYFLNSNTGWACGSSGKVFKTTNAGNNWSLILSENTNRFYSIYFADENNGWVAGAGTMNILPYGGKIEKTTNGGLNWSEQIFNNIDFYSINFINSNTGYSVGNRGEILKTVNGGINWFSQSTSLITDFQSLFFTDLNTGWAIGNSYYVFNIPDTGKIFKSINGGVNWVPQIIDTSKPFQNLYSVSFVNLNTGWILGNKNIFKTTNAGNNWYSQTIDTTGLTADFFLNDNTGWVISNKGTYKTSDGGNNWVYKSNGRPYNIFFVNENTGWGGESKGTFAKTTNGGTNWTWYYTNPWLDKYVGPFFFINANTGWFAISAYIFKTTNEGNNWSYVTLLDGSNSIYFINEYTGYAVGRRILKTTDGGNTWNERTDLFYNNYWNSVFFLNENTGWVAGSNGAILKTTNGGVGIKPISNNIPDNYYLSQNYPNPFNPITKIKFDVAQHTPYPLSRGDNISLKVYDILGKEVATLVNETLQPGSYEVTFDGTNLSSGIYFYQLKTGDYIMTKKLLLLK